MEVVLVRSKEPRGVLMVFHGCMRRPTDWWHYEPTCVTCIGKELLQSQSCVTHAADPRQSFPSMLLRCPILQPGMLSPMHMPHHPGCGAEESLASSRV